MPIPTRREIILDMWRISEDVTPGAYFVTHKPFRRRSPVSYGIYLLQDTASDPNGHPSTSRYRFIPVDLIMSDEQPPGSALLRW
jgi:hypothetical protein